MRSCLYFISSVFVFLHSSTANSQLQNLLACHGRPVLSIDLRAQFGPTEDQGPEGICYACAATAGVEAARFRSTGERCQLSSQVAAVVAAQKERERPARFRAMDATVVGTTSATQKFYNGGSPYHVAKSIVNSKQFPERSEALKCSFSQISTEATIAAQKGTVVSQVVYSSENDERLQNIKKTEDIFLAQALKLGPRFELSNLRPLRFTSAFPDFNNKELSAHRTALLKSNKSGDFSKNPLCSLDNPRNKEAIEHITKSLCVGQSVVASLYFNGADESKDGGQKWSRYDTTLTTLPQAVHSMVLDGLAYDAIEKKYFFYFRNSWAKGTDETPHKSRARIPVEEACRIYDMFRIQGPKDVDPFSRDLSCQTVEGSNRLCKTIVYKNEGAKPEVH